MPYRMLFFIPLKIDRIRFIRENLTRKKTIKKNNNNKIIIIKKKENKNERKILFFGLRLG